MSWLLRNMPGKMAAGMALLLLCSCANPELPAVAAHSPPSTGAHDLRVMTFNLRVREAIDGPNIWERRRDQVVERIRHDDPDLLGTQEGMDFMEEFLRQQLGEYTFFGAGRGDGTSAGEMCGIFYRTARFELLDRGHFWLSSTPEKPGSRSWGAGAPRIVTWTKLRPRDGGVSFYWFNTHFDAWSARARTKSAGVLREERLQIAGSMPCIVTGDFNCNAGSAPYRTLLAAGPPADAVPLRDAFRSAHPAMKHDEGTFHFFTGWRHGPRMDWILVSPHFQIVESEIDHARGRNGYPSDHFPVTAVLRAGAAERWHWE